MSSSPSAQPPDAERIGTNPESLLVLRCATTSLAQCARSEIEALLSRPLDWGRVLRLGRRHRVLSLLYLNLHRLASPAAPAAVLAELRGQFMKNAARNLQLSAELLRLLDPFEKNNTPMVPFKGVVLASFVYGDPALRDAGDIDLLVHRNDIVRAADLLCSLGHRPFYPTASAEETAFLSSLQGARRAAYLQYHGEHHLVREDGLLNVDLHWQVTHRAISRGLETKALFSGLTPIELGGRTIRTFGPEHLLLVLCDNGAKDGWARLDRVCDVAELLRRNPNLDWETVLTTARQIGAERMLLLGLSLANRLLDAPIPAEIHDRLREKPFVADLATTIAAQLLDQGGPEASKISLSLLHLHLADSLRGRLRYCRMQLRSNVGEWMLVPLPSRFWFLYSVIRPVRLVGRFLVNRLLRTGRTSGTLPTTV
jgi:hypothetical protein